MTMRAYDMESIRKGAIHRLYRARTAILRAVARCPSEQEHLRQRIRSRVKELGRWYEDGNSDLVEFTYHPILFRGFEDLRSHRGEGQARLEAILSRLSVATGDWILDVGANVGFFAFSLERLGALVEAYEPNSPTFEIGAALSKLHNTNVLYINKPFNCASVQYLRPHYKAVLLLSVFHWIVKQEGKDGAARILQELAKRADLIFFEVPASSGDGMFQHEIFSSKETVEGFLREVIPGVKLSELACDEGWGGRVLRCLDCRESRF